MQFFKKIYLLAIVLVLASLIRFYHLNSNPPSLTWDEAALGYNSYSILKTGRDEYGAFLPLNLKSFGDYKPAIYAYLDIPFVAILGLNEWAVRLPSAIFGVLAVLGVFLLVLELFKNRSIALFSSLMMVISPWAIQFSRPAFEANIAMTLNIFATYFFVKGLKNGKWLYFSALIFGLSLYTYQASRLLVPLIIILLLVLFWPYIKKAKDARVSAIIFGVFLIILVTTTFLSGQTNRLATVNVFSYQRSNEVIQTISNEDGIDSSSWQFQVLHGEWWAFTRGLAERYFVYFSPKILFVDGDSNQRDRVPDLGALYYFSLLLIPLGLLYLVKKKTKESWLILGWLVIAPLPAVFARDLISDLRALNMVVAWSIVEGIGFYVVVKRLRETKGVWGYLGIATVLLLMTFNFFIYLDRYFVHSPLEYSKFWLYGYKQALSGLVDRQNSYNKVVVTDIYGQPYIYYLFYNKYPPEKFQKQAKLDQPTVDVGTVRNIDNIEFRHIYWPDDRSLENNLYIGSADELPEKDILPFDQARIIKDINYLNGEQVFRVVETKP